MYKDEVQKLKEEKLKRKFLDENVPMFIQKYFINLESKTSCLNYWAAIKDLLLWLINKNIINKNSIEFIEPNDFQFVESEDITLFLREKEKSGMLPSSVNTRKNIYSSFWGYLVRTNRCNVSMNIVNSVKYKYIACSENVVKKMPKEWQLEEMEKKISNRKNDFLRIRNLAIFNLLKWSGIREAELVGLDLKDVFLTNAPYIKVLGKGHYRETEKRKVYITSSAASYLKNWMDYRMNINKGSGALFINKTGKRTTESDVKKLFEHNSSGITPHMMRHWYATFISSKTGNIAIAQQQLGHRNLNVTINNYIDGSEEIKTLLQQY